MESRNGALDVGLDVSLKLTAICVVDRSGKIEREGAVLAAASAVGAASTAIAASVHNGRPPQRHVATVDCAVMSSLSKIRRSRGFCEFRNIMIVANSE